jgi:hypothetical protein
MKYWMNRLAGHHDTMKRRYPEDELIVLFDIDDTILDLRYMILHVLRSFDRRHGTNHFGDLALCHMGVSEGGVRRALEGFGIEEPEVHRIMEWFIGQSWSAQVVRNAHHPFPGVMDVIGWLQLQPMTSVGLNTGRPETIRKETLRCLNRIGRPRGVSFTGDLLFMSRYPWGERISDSKAEGIRHFKEKGYRITAFVDNEPENLKAVADMDGTDEILLLHADTVYGSAREHIPQNAVSGSVYDVAVLQSCRNPKFPLGRVA